MSRDIGSTSSHKKNAMDIIWKLYKEGRTIPEITEITRLEKSLVEAFIIDAKMNHINIQLQETTSSTSILKEILKLDKTARIKFLDSLDESINDALEKEISAYVNAANNIHYEDIITILWVIGERKLDNLSELVCSFSASKNGNIQRIAYSTMGKIKNKRFIPYLKMGCKNKGIQIRMYAIKSLAKYRFYGDEDFFGAILENEVNERNKEIIKETIINLQKGE